MSISDLIPANYNPRKISDSDLTHLKKSLTEFSAVEPAIINRYPGRENVIVGGHQRIKAAKSLGWKIFPCVFVDLPEPKERELNIRLNKNTGEFDMALLGEFFQESDLLDWGFEKDELGNLFNETVDGLTDSDAVPEAPAEPITVLGDIWLLGGHRLMCGDSTSIDAVEKLMNGQKADMVFTDPPYNVAFNGRTGKHEVIVNDNLAEDEFDQFIGEVLQTIKAVNAPAYYIWCNWKFYATLQRELEYKSCIVWAKNVFGMGTNYRHQHEFCLFNGNIDTDIKNESDLWQVKKDTNYVHPTQKPVELSERALGNHCDAKNILDLFGGSGSTLIGCEKMKRRAFVMELDPKYCDVIVKRWQDFTGKKAILESTGKTYEEMASEARG